MMGLYISEYIKNIKRNIVSVILLTLSLTMILLTIGNLREAYKYYDDIKSHISDKGICSLEFIYKDIDSIKNKLDNTKGVASYKMYTRTFVTSINDDSFGVYLLDSNQEKNLMPKLLEGKWENSDSSDTNTMRVLVSQNDMGLHSGDEIMGQYFLSNGDSKNITIKIDGVFENGERIPGYIRYSSLADISYETFYGVFDFEQNEKLIFVSTEEEIQKFKDIVCYPCELGLIQFGDDLSEDEISDLSDDITNFFTSEEGINTIGKIQLESVNENSRIKINKIIMRFIPFAIVAFMLAIICSIASSAVDTLEGVYRYTVFYLNGMKWSSGIKLSAFSAGCNIVLSILLMIGTVCILQLNNISMAYKIQYRFYEILIVGIVCVFFFFSSIIMPIIIIRKERPAELLKKNE